MPQAWSIEKFISESRGKGNVIDVRSPAEFAQGHIPGALNIPLFSNEERAVVGTTYKQKSRQEAVLKGLEIVAPKLESMVANAASHADGKNIFVHCWRGGMRSGFLATLLEMYGLNVVTLKNGYKAYRHLVLNSFNKKLILQVLGGKTGSGKTLLLKKLKEEGQQVIDLERLANHKGSAFGALGEPEQPTQEQFENDLADQLLSVDDSQVLWLEDESRMIGKKVIPGPFWDQMRAARVIYLQLPFEARLNYILSEYGKYPKEGLEESIGKISRRMGPEQCKIALHALQNNDIKTAFSLCLEYYDKTYSHGLSKREQNNVEEIHLNEMDIQEIYKMLIGRISSHA